MTWMIYWQSTMLIIIKADRSVHFNLKDVGFTLNEKEITVRFFLNLYHYISRNAHVFNEYRKRGLITEQEWYLEYKRFYKFLDGVKGNSAKSKRYGRYE
jgi:hypothetical protein